MFSSDNSGSYKNVDMSELSKEPFNSKMEFELNSKESFKNSFISLTGVINVLSFMNF